MIHYILFLWGILCLGLTFGLSTAATCTGRHAVADVRRLERRLGLQVVDCSLRTLELALDLGIGIDRGFTIDL